MMKKTIKYSLIAFFAVTLTACEHDTLMDWEGGKNIYFTHLLVSGTHARTQDTIDLRFFFMPDDVDEILVPISVTTTGTFTNEDREVSLTVSSFLQEGISLTEIPFVEGEHFEIERSFIRAGRVEDTVWIRVFRSPELGEEGRLGIIGLTLLPNQHFTTDLRETQDGPIALPRTLLTRWIIVSDAIVRPRFWNNNFFGPYSAEKFRIIRDANSTPGNIMPWGFLDGETEWNNTYLVDRTSVLFPWWTVIGSTTQFWLDDWHSNPANDTIWDPVPNAEGVIVIMSMGPQITGN